VITSDPDAIQHRDKIR